MAQAYPRSITFTIPGQLGVQITVVENAGNLDFTVAGNPQLTADLKGLFFELVDESVLGTLKILGGDGLINTQIKANAINAFLDPDHVNLALFDVGINFGGPGKVVTGPVHFTLDAVRDLTLDDIAHVLFGATTAGNVLTSGRFSSPAAPNARDDTVVTPEDKAITIRVLANDTDADFQQLKVTSVHLDSGAHGTAKIAADGKSITFTPDKDYAGLNVNPSSIDATFKYTISDGFGGEDTANVNVHVVPVADQPKVTFDVLSPEAGDPINMVRLKVIATQSDLDGSEFIDRIEFSALPTAFTLITDGSLSTIGQPNTVTEYVQLLTPTGQDVDYDLKVTAFSQEKGNGIPDEASASATKHIGIDFTHNQTQETFDTSGQSIWGTGGEISHQKDLFLGVDAPFSESIADGFFFINGHFKGGLTETIDIHGGAINAHLPYDITVDTTYNKTVDSLLIHTVPTLQAGAGFTTTGPGGSYSLGALLDFVVNFGINDPTGILSFSQPFSVQPDQVSLTGSYGSISSDAPSLYTFPLPNGSLNLAWPQLSTTSGAPTGDTILGSGSSNNFVQLNADLDAWMATLFPIFFPIEELIGPDHTDPEGSFEWLDIEGHIGAKLLQDFVLKVLKINGTLTFENGSTQQFVLGNDIVLKNASQLDVNHDGKIEFSMFLNPDVTLDNNTWIELNAGADLYFAKNASILGISVPGTPIHEGVTSPITKFSIDDSGPFQLALIGQSYDFSV